MGFPLSDNINIAFFTEKECCPTIGGIERATMIVSSSLRSLFKYRVYHIFNKTIDPSVPHADFDDTLKIDLNKRSESELRDFIIKYNISLIVNQGFFKFGLFFNNLNKKYELNCKQIFAFHFNPSSMEKLVISPAETLNMWRKEKSSKQLIKLLFYPFFYCIKNYQFSKQYRDAEIYSDKIVLLSESHKNQWYKFAHPIKKIINTDLFSVIPNALSFDHFANIEEILSKSKSILIVCRLSDREKKISSAIKIWENISSNNVLKDWYLDIVGDGPDFNDLQKYVNDHKIERINFHGRQNPKPFYKKAAIFMMTSKYEGFAITLIEASQFGVVPIAFSSYTALYDIITDGINGYCIPTNDQKAYGDKIIELANDENLRFKLANYAVENAKRFSPETISKMWNDLILQTLKE